MTNGETLKARARALARRPIRPRDMKRTLEVVEFRLAGERYAIEHGFVKAVLPLKDLTPLPCTPPFVRGIVNVRGQLVAVINFRKLFDLPESGIADVHLIIIVHWEGIELGIEADTVTGIRTIELDNVQASLPTLTGIRAQYLKGVTDERIAILDAQKILTDPKIVVNDEVET